MFSFLRNCSTVFPSGCPILCHYRQYRKGSVSPHPCQYVPLCFWLRHILKACYSVGSFSGHCSLAGLKVYSFRHFCSPKASLKWPGIIKLPNIFILASLTSSGFYLVFFFLYGSLIQFFFFCPFSLVKKGKVSHFPEQYSELSNILCMRKEIFILNFR